MTFIQNLINTLKNNYIQIFSTFIGIMWITLYIIIRFFITRIPYKLHINVPITALLFVLILLCSHIFILFATIYTFFQHKETKNKTILFFKELVNTLYWNPLIAVHDNFIRNIPYSGYLWQDLLTTFSRFCYTEKRLYISVICLDFIPRIIVASAFFIDVVIYKQFAYLYILVVIIIIPLIFQAFIYIGYNFGLRNRNIIEKSLNVFHDIINDCPFFEIKNGYNSSPEILEESSNAWLMFSSFKNICETVKEYKNTNIRYILLYTSTCYIIGWSTYLCYMLQVDIVTILYNDFIILHLVILVYFLLLYILLYLIIIYIYKPKPYSINPNKAIIMKRKQRKKTTKSY
jgi:hypothetical protein